jgi:hypothetical protein
MKPPKPGKRVYRFYPETPTRDHIMPRCLGGQKGIVVCHACNMEKSDRTPTEWLEYLDSTGDRRAGIVAMLYRTIVPELIT